MRLHRGQISYLRHYQTLYLNGQNSYFAPFSIDGGIANSFTPVNETIYACPIYFGRMFVLKQYGVYVYSVTTGGAKIQYGIFDNLIWKRYPGKKIDENQHTNVTATGFYSKTLGSPIIIPKNKLLWMVFQKDTVGVLTIDRPNLQPFTLGYDTSGTAGSKRGWSYNDVWRDSGFQTPWPSGGSLSNTAPQLFFKD